MGYYDLSESERKNLSATIHKEIEKDLRSGYNDSILTYYSHEDTYIRKAAYMASGRIAASPEFKSNVLEMLEREFQSDLPKVRQTVINTAGEIGMTDFESIAALMEKGLFDAHHSVRNAVIGSMKKAGEKNPLPVLAFARKFLSHPDKEIRREICHGIELRGRKHPQDILPLLKELQFDSTARVSNTLVHVLGQIAYKKNCLETVLKELRHWENKQLVNKALEEIVDVHERYKNFAALTQTEAMQMIRIYFE